MAPTLTSFLSCLPSVRKNRKARPPKYTRGRTRLTVERLEDRWVPAFMLRFSTDGGATFGSPIVDGGPGDTSSLPNFIGANIGPLSITSSANNFINPAISLLNLSLSGQAAAGAHNLVVQASVDFINTAPPPQTLDYDFSGSILPGGGSVTMQTWIDNSNTLFGTTGPGIVGNTGPQSAIPASAGSVPFGGIVHYAATTEIHAVFTSTLGASLSLQSVNSIIPSPIPPPEARITITPDATNEVGQPHTFTATVEQDDGLAAGAPGGDAVTGFGPAAGAATTIDLVNTNGATATPTSFTGTTNAAGQFQGVFSSPTAGLVIGNAAATIIVGGQTLVRDTDPATADIGAGPGGSDSAVKTYVDANITITPDATNEVGQPHAFTVTALENAGDGLGFVPAAGEAVTVYLTNTNGATTSPLNYTGTTNAAGQFLVTFNSATAGQVIGNASASIVVGGLTLVRDTDPATAGIGAGPGGSGPAVKTYVDARITIAPDATNEVGQPHTFTVTVEENAGNGSFVPAAGETVTVTLTNTNGASTPTMTFNGTTNAAGQFQVTFASATAGQVTGTATATVVVGGLTLTRDTDPATAAIGAGPGGSGPAVKTFVDAKITITPDATNEVGQPHTFTVAVLQDDGLSAAQGGDGVTGFAPAANKPVTLTLSNANGAAATPPGPFTLTTDAAGQATATFTSAAAGLVTGNASTGFTVGGVFLTRDTDPATATVAGPGGSGPALKRFVDAKVVITPDATNEVGQPHTFTVTVLENTGDGAGFVAAAGEIVTVTLTNMNGAAAPTTTFNGTTNAAGQFQVTFASPTAGLVTGNATASVLVGGLTLVRDTDPATADIGAGPGGSGPAVKRYVDARITITPDATNEVGQPHTFTVTIQENAGDGAGFVPASGETVTVTLTNTNGASTPTITFTGTTNASGQFLVTFASPTAGQVIGNATSAVDVGGLSLNRDTDPATATVAGPGGSGLALKTFVDARIVLSPLAATNVINDPHVITATVMQDDGLTAAQGGDGVTGFAPAPNGTVVTFSLVNSGGALANFVGGNTAAVTGGVAMVTINSPTAGLVILNATTTFVIGGVTLTRDTNPATSPLAGPGGSGPAQKIYVRPGIDMEKTTNGPTNSNPTAPDYDNEDDMHGPGVPILTPGSTVTWTYKVTNTGGVPFAFAEVVVVDDNGTPGITADDLSTTGGQITFLSVQAGDADNILEPGEVWLYTASGIVQNVSTPAGPPTTFDFSGGSALDGADGNVRTFTAGTTSVKASAFSRDKGTGAWGTAYLGSYGGGLGVTDSSEGDGSGNTHTVDNVGRDNYVLFRFSENVVIDAAFLGYVVNDSDLSVWIGTIPNAFNASVALSDALLTSLGFTEVNLTDLTSTRWADLNAGNLSGNVLVIAAWTGDDTPEDRFKIELLKVRAPQPGCYENRAVVTVPGDGDSDLSHYCNPAVPPTPGIDIEKTTNGPTNSNPTAPNYDNEDAANGPGVPVLSPGSTVTWKYRVTNTGNLPFAASQVVVVDDNGTSGNTADDFTPTRDLATDVGGDSILSPGEVWFYTATGTVQNLSTPAPGSTVTFDFSGGSALDGADGNVRTFTAGTTSVKASAFSRDKGTGAWGPAYLGSYGGGLGVTDSSEGDGSGNTHTVDNVGRDNFVLFEFSETVIIDAAFLGYVVNDSDLSVWIGTIPNVFNSHQTLSDALLTSLGFTEVNLTDLTSTRWADLNAGNLSGNVLVIAAWTGDDTPEDRFKIELLKVSKPQPGTYANRATVTVPGDSDSDLSHYKNPTSPPPPPTGSISGKKYKDVSGNGLNTAAGPSSPADVPMAGVTIYLDLDNDGLKDAHEPSKVTNASGEFTFSGLTAGTYRVREVVPAGFIRTAPVLSDVYVVNLAAGENETGKNFANAEKCEECTITNLSFRLVHADGTVETVTSLQGRTRQGDVIKATFTLNIPAGTTHPVSLVSYTAPSATFDANTASQQEIYDLAAGNFGPGTHSLTIGVPNSYYQVDLVCGLAIDQFGPAGSNIFYTPQMRLENADNGGNRAYGANQIAGQFAALAFWKGTNGQNVIKSFNGGSTATALGHWLAATFQNLFGSITTINGSVGSLAGKTNAQIATIVAGLSTSTTTKSVYAQAFAVALGIYANTRSLGGQSLIDNGKAVQFGFNVSLAGGGVSPYAIGSNTAAFGGMGATPTVVQILLRVNANFSPSAANFYGGGTATGQANTVLNGINTGGDIALVTTDSVSTGEDQALVSKLRPLAEGNLVVAVDALPQELAGGEARIADVVAWINASLAEFGLTLRVVPGGDSVVADIYVHFAGTSVIGGVPEGVLGVTESGGQLTVITGWDYYLKSDPSGIGVGQYDFATVVAHELGHAVGLGHSLDLNSVMFPFLGTAQVRRVLTLPDLTAVRHAETGEAEGLRVAAAAKQPLPGCASLDCIQAATVVAGMIASKDAGAAVADRMGFVNPSAAGTADPTGRPVTDPRRAADFFQTDRSRPAADGWGEPAATRPSGARAVAFDINEPAEATAAADPVLADPDPLRATVPSADWFGGSLSFDDADDLLGVCVD